MRSILYLRIFFVVAVIFTVTTFGCVPSNCNGNGYCNGGTNTCYCFSGWAGSGCDNAISELQWEVNSTFTISGSQKFFHFSTTPSQQFSIEYYTNGSCDGTFAVLKYSCDSYYANCDPLPSCTNDSVACNFDYALSQSTLFPYAPNKTGINARNGCGCQVQNITAPAQNWIVLVENLNISVCTVTLRVSDTIVKSFINQIVEYTVGAQSIFETYIDVTRASPVQFSWNQGSCAPGTKIYMRLRYQCNGNTSPTCGSMVKYPTSSNGTCTYDNECNSPVGICYYGTCLCNYNWGGPDCSYFKPQYSTSNLIYTNYNSQPFEYGAANHMESIRSNCGCGTNNTGSERWYLSFHNDNYTSCNISFYPYENTFYGYNNGMYSANYGLYTPAYTAENFLLPIAYQKLNIQVETTSIQCAETIAIHQVCGDAGDCFTAPYWQYDSPTNFDIYGSILGIGYYVANVSFLQGVMGSCGCSIDSTSSQVYISVFASQSTGCSYNILATAVSICQNGGIYNPGSGLCACPTGFFGDYCETALGVCREPNKDNSNYQSDVCIYMNSTCLCTSGFGTNYFLYLYSPATTELKVGFQPKVLGIDNNGIPEIDIFSVMTYKYYNPKHNKQLTLRFGAFDTPINITLAVIISTVEPNATLFIQEGSVADSYYGSLITYTNTLFCTDKNLTFHNITGNGTVTFSDLLPKTTYYIKIASVGYYVVPGAQVLKNSLKRTAFTYSLSVEPDDTYAEVVDIVLLIVLILVLILPCIVVPFYRRKLSNKSFLPALSSVKSGNQKSSMCTKITIMLFSAIFFLGFRLFRVIFNLSILFYSFGRFAHFPDISELWNLFPNNMRDVLAQWSNFLGSLNTFITDFVFLNDKFCTGAISETYLISIIIAFYFLFITLRMNLLIIIVMGTRRWFTGNKVLASVYGGIADAVGNAFFYLIQFAVFTIYNVLDGLFKLQGGCSSFDTTFNTKFKVFGYILIVPLVILCLFAFMPQKMERLASRNKTNPVELVKYILGTLFMGAFSIIAVTIGVWNDFTVKNYEIIERANKYDDDPNDADTRQETVIGYTGKSVSLIWLLIPGLAVVTKYCEVVSENVILDDRRAGLDLITPKKERIIKFILAALVLALQIATVWTLSMKLLGAVFGIVVLQAVEKFVTDVMKLMTTTGAI